MSKSTDRPDRVSALDARDDLLAIADTWPDLLERLVQQGSSGSDGMPTAVVRDETGIEINEYVSQVHFEVMYWAQFLARVLMDEVVISWTVDGETFTKPWAPRNTGVPDMLTEIARTRIGHFTSHPDKMLRLAFFDDAKDMRRKIEHAAYPQGPALDTGIACESHDTSDKGERIICAGVYTVRPLPADTIPDLICSVDRTHMLSPDVWSRPSWKLAHEQKSA